MKVEEFEIEGLKLITPQIFGDNRGFFTESYSYVKFCDIGITNVFVQDNHSSSDVKKTLRGLHFQLKEKAQSKLVRCTRGTILDVAVDLRKNSPTYKKHVAVTLSEDNHQMFYIPKGFAHGFLTLCDNCEIQYKVDEYYSFDHDRSIRFDDEQLNINWGVDAPILSNKDINAPFLKDSDIDF